jgi:hypothetical protein
VGTVGSIIIIIVAAAAAVVVVVVVVVVAALETLPSESVEEESQQQRGSGRRVTLQDEVAPDVRGAVRAPLLLRWRRTVADATSF